MSAVSTHIKTLKRIEHTWSENKAAHTTFMCQMKKFSTFFMHVQFEIKHLRNERPHNGTILEYGSLQPQNSTHFRTSLTLECIRGH